MFQRPARAYRKISRGSQAVPNFTDALAEELQTVARLLPLTYAVSLLRGIWKGEGWAAHAGDVAMLTLVMAALTALSARVFRWE